MAIGLKNLTQFILIVITTWTRVALTCCTHDSLCEEEIIGFRKLGVHHSYRESGRVTKVYHLAMDFEGNWMDSRSYCKTYDMELVTFDTSYEFSSFVKIAMKNRNYFDKWTHIGGISKFNGKNREWFWVNGSRRINFPIQFATGQPNNYLGRQNCLGISKEEKTFEFQDIDCHGRFEEKFMCQKLCKNN